MSRHGLKSAKLKVLVKKVVAITDWADYVSPSDLTNYMLDDPVLDYFKIKAKGIKRSRGGQIIGGGNMSIGGGFEDYIKNQGIQFEQDIYEGILDKYPDKVVEIDEGTPADKFKNTLIALESNIPIIYQGMLIDTELKTFGLPDLLIRSDWIRKLFPETAVKKSRARSIFGRFHYIVVDIKWSTLHFRSGRTTLRKHGRIESYKSQLYVYTEALSKIQKYSSSVAYIWGRAWIHESCNIKTRGSGDDFLGEIDYNGIDQHIVEKTYDAINWISELREKYKSWSINPPSRDELYPNMKNRFNGNFAKQKKNLADNIKEITSLWYCGISARRKAHDLGITRYDDLRLTAGMMGLGGNRERILNQILEVNQIKDFKVLPAMIEDNTYDWQTPPELTSTSDVIEFFIDFETIGGFMMDPVDIGPDRVFMIGLGRMAPIPRSGLRSSDDGRWEYKCFTAKSVDKFGEAQIFTELYDYLESFGSDKTFKLYHWGRAEYEWLMKVCEENPNSNFYNSYIDDAWINFHEIVSQEPIVVKGATNFSLKTITRAMHKLGLINCQWEEECCDGMNAMVKAWRCYCRGRGEKDPRMAPIRRYNEVDCKAVALIVDYLRRNHAKPVLDEEELTDIDDIDSIDDIDGIDNELTYESSEEYVTTKKRKIEFDLDLDLTNSSSEMSEDGYVHPSEDNEEYSPDNNVINSDIDEYASDADDWIPGTCWFCEDECNEQSQTCGKCARKLQLIKL